MALWLRDNAAKRAVVAGNISGFADTPVDPSAPLIPVGDLAIGGAYAAGTYSAGGGGGAYAASPAWTLTHSQDFDTVRAQGTVFATGSPYIGAGTASDIGTMKLTAYPVGWLDTRQVGTYDNRQYSVSASTLRLKLETTVNHPNWPGQDGKHLVGAVRPTVSAQPNGGRYVVCWRSDYIPTYKVAWLLWPDETVPAWPALGEIDFPEQGNLDNSSHIFGYMHDMNGSSPTYPQHISTGQPSVVGSGWHVEAIEWLPNADPTLSTLKFIHDGVIVGYWKGVTVPNHPMRPTLQTETNLSGIPIDPGASGFVDVAWYCRYGLT